MAMQFVSAGKQQFSVDVTTKFSNDEVLKNRSLHPVDNRPLYERLKEQRMKEEEEFAESHAIPLPIAVDEVDTEFADRLTAAKNRQELLIKHSDSLAMAEYQRELEKRTVIMKEDEGASVFRQMTESKRATAKKSRGRGSARLAHKLPFRLNSSSHPAAVSAHSAPSTSPPTPEPTTAPSPDVQPAPAPPSTPDPLAGTKRGTEAEAGGNDEAKRGRAEEEGEEGGGVFDLLGDYDEEDRDE
eukprot:gnl/Trimastix_PCT/2950.p1 GENE.gnl/Trimastix_PCT/2950~~gnl/Trimastix_PCT/2950.p1  ORF type:complete len:242 (-),score=47.97 gnl/Trimastix_PCT/2950:12-737(-)